MLDASLLLDKTPKVIAAASPAIDVISSNVSDQVTAVKLFEGSTRNPPRFMVGIKITAGTSPTVRARYVGADDAALTSNVVILADSGTRTKDTDGTALASGDFVALDIPVSGQTIAKRYYGAIYTPGVVDEALEVTASIVESAQTHDAYRKAAVP
jgi:hypothetical protein